MKTYIITGIDRQKKRFRYEYNNYPYISMINIFRGSIWMSKNGKRTLIKRVYN